MYPRQLFYAWLSATTRLNDVHVHPIHGIFYFRALRVVAKRYMLISVRGCIYHRKTVYASRRIIGTVMLENFSFLRRSISFYFWCVHYYNSHTLKGFHSIRQREIAVHGNNNSSFNNLWKMSHISRMCSSCLRRPLVTCSFGTRWMMLWSFSVDGWKNYRRNSSFP